MFFMVVVITDVRTAEKNLIDIILREKTFEIRINNFYFPDFNSSHLPESIFLCFLHKILINYFHCMLFIIAFEVQIEAFTD